MAKFSLSRAEEDEENTEPENTEEEGPSTPIQTKRRRTSVESSDNPNRNNQAEEEKSGWPVTLMDPEVLDCSICMEPLAPPVFQCENGHIACSPCCSKLHNKCPSCSWPIGYNRCLAIEKVIESIKVPCVNRPYGCKETVNFTQKHAHIEICTYSPCVCPIVNCEFCGSSKQLSDHFTSKHRSCSMRFVYNSRFSVSFSQLDPYLVFQGGDGRLFVLSNEFEAVGSAITVACLGERSLNRGFSYELISRKGTSSLRLQSKMKCVRQRVESACSACSEGFLLVPNDFYSSGKLNLEICIRESGDAS